jgi:hypothetical protein
MIELRGRKREKVAAGREGRKGGLVKSGLAGGIGGALCSTLTMCFLLFDIFRPGSEVLVQRTELKLQSRKLGEILRVCADEIKDIPTNMVSIHD